MRSRRRTPAFDSLEGLMLLSAFHPSVAHPSPHVNGGKLPAFVRAVVQDAKQIGGKHVTVTPVLAAPGSGAEYLVTFTVHGQSYSNDIWVPYHGPKYGPQPG